MLSRTDNMTQSLQDWIKSKLDAAGYTGQYALEDVYPHERQNPLDQTIIVIAHDDSGDVEERELGGPLSAVARTFQCDVLGQDHRWGRNLASLIKEALEGGEPIPLNDYTSGAPVQIDLMTNVIAVHTQPRFTNPKPWQLHWNVVTFTVDDEFNRAYLA